MLARGTSQPREDSPASTAIPLTSLTTHHPPHHRDKKRKHNALASSTAAPSPAPSELGSSANPAENVVLPSYHDLATRPRLTISRAPTFVPVEGRPDYYTTEQLAVNRIGFRYTPAGLQPPGSTLPFRTIESAPTAYRVSWEDRSPFVKVTQDGLGLLGDKGFRSARCNAPVREGKWYLEIKVENGGGERPADAPPSREGAHVRLGWARREAPLNGPCGLDAYSYGVRDKTGEKVTLSRLRPYGAPFGAGDVVGMYIALPPLRAPVKNDPHDPAHIKRERIAIEFKGQEYFESLEYSQSKEMVSLMDFSRKATDTAPLPSSTKKSATVKNVPERGRGAPAVPEPAPLRPLPILPGSVVAFFVNGVCQGAAYRDIYDFRPLRAPANSRKAREKKRAREGTREHKENPFDDGCLGYFPFISLFNEARVRINPGPDFSFTPPPDIDALLSGADASPSAERAWRPISERYAEFMEEQWALDRLEEDEARVEAAQRDEVTRVEDAKKAQRERKRAQAEAKKRAKREAESAAATPTLPDPDPQELKPQREKSAAPREESIAPREESMAPREESMAPREESMALREESMAPVEESVPPPEEPRYPSEPMPAFVLSGFAMDSPAPTGTSTPGIQSTFGSEYGEGDPGPEEEEEEEEELVGDGALNYDARYRLSMRMEMEEDE
ncbi:hypothetical protein BV25DRAFT_1827348 [Artomyces pyxidatus]|uniref:Uncharacterized protein n=1 Tax=Artomyces pyxidatus TaxID=48021 RepID=A0ACB8SX72_9AGAM|nr:hypothetical protein BV25DRAFT_1827348 [Artomyces pyxidatus]